jgi:putative endopeptidase
MKRTLCSTLIAGLFAVAAHAGAHDEANTSAPSTAAAAAVSGVDKAAMDTGVRAQDDFFRHTQGNWLQDVEIPSDRSSWSAFSVAQENVENQIRAIIEQAAADTKAAKGSNAQKMGDYYNSYLDEARRNALGLTPLKAELARIAALKDKRGIAALSAHMERIGDEAPLGMYVGQDSKDSTRYVVSVGQSGLGLPNRDYYLADEARMKDFRAKYQVHIEKMLTLAGHKDAALEAAKIVALETEIAKVQWSAVENRDPVKRYNKMTFAQLKDLMPGFDWTTWMKDVGVAGKVDSIIVSQPSYLAGLDKIIAATPVDTWKSYYAFHALSVADFRRRELCLPRHRAVGHQGKPSAEQACDRPGQPRAERGSGQGLRGAPLPGRAQGAGRGDGEELHPRLQGRHRDA